MKIEDVLKQLFIKCKVIILRKYLHLKEVNEFPVLQEIIDRGLLYRPYRISFY